MVNLTFLIKILPNFMNKENKKTYPTKIPEDNKLAEYQKFMDVLSG